MAWKEISARYLNLTQEQSESKLKEKGFKVTGKIMSYNDTQVNYYQDGKQIAIYDIGNYELIILVEETQAA